MMRMAFRWCRANRFMGKCAAIGVLLAFVAVACLFQLASVQLLNGRSIAQAATASRTKTVVINARRGRILDASGVVLAQSVERYTIIADPELAQSFTPTDCTAQTKDNCHEIDGKPVGATGAAAVARLLAPVLDMDAKELGGMLSGTGQYAVLKRDVTPEAKRRIDDLNLGGSVYAELGSERLYANGTLLGALLGGVDDDGTGVAGIEQMENSTLTGADGYRIYQRGGEGVQIPGTITESKDAVNGADVTLSIDSNVDWYVKQVVDQAKERYQAEWVIAVVQEVGTGRILALEDSDRIEAGSGDAKLNSSRAVSQIFEPGSIGKVFAMAGMLQAGTHRLTDNFTVPGTITKDGQTYKDSFSHGDERWTLAGILEQSSNVGMVMAGENYPNEQRYEILSKFGIGRDGLGLPGESDGMLAQVADWDRRTQNTVLFGQGYATNALQLTNAIATIANKGVKQPQVLVSSVTDANGHVEEVKRGEGVRIVDEQVAAQMMNAMESSGGHYASFAGVDGYRVAAKSGTAEVAGPNGGLSSIISDWSGAIPADNPRFVVTVVMKDPHGSYGGVTSGPVFKQIAEFLMQKYEVPVSAPRKDAVPVTW